MTGETIAMIKALQNKSIEELKTSGGSSDAGKVLTVGSDGKITPTNLPVGEGEIAVDGSLSVSGAAADAKKTGDAISALNGSLSYLNSDKELWQIGAISATNGSNTDSTKYLRTGISQSDESDTAASLPRGDLHRTQPIYAVGIPQQGFRLPAETHRRP